MPREQGTLHPLSNHIAMARWGWASPVRILVVGVLASIISGVPASANVTIGPPFAAYHAEDCVYSRRLIFENSCQSIAWAHPTGNIRLNMAVGAPIDVPTSGQAYGRAGMVTSHDLTTPAAAVTYTATLRINYANITRASTLLLDREVGGRAHVRLDVRHLDQPNCGGGTSQTILDFEEGLSSYQEGPLTLTISLEGCGAQIDPGRVMIDVQADADAGFFDDLIGDAGSIQTVFDLDVLAISVHVD